MAGEEDKGTKSARLGGKNRDRQSGDPDVSLGLMIHFRSYWAIRSCGPHRMPGTELNIGMDASHSPPSRAVSLHSRRAHTSPGSCRATHAGLHPYSFRFGSGAENLPLNMLSGDADAAGVGSPLCVLPGDFGGLHVKTTEGETIYPSYHSRMGQSFR